MEAVITVKLKLWGIVQGVGFRPFVAKLADEREMAGRVLNSGGLVEITLTDTRANIDGFIEALKKQKPDPAEIVHIKQEELPYQPILGFQIVDSNDGENEAAMIPADLPICPECRKELFDEGNPRYLHPFISCMHCGPRYTIIDRIPYDRENTAMVDFPLCESCSGEYTDRKDRRYHAQTISCHHCGPMLLCRLPGGEAGERPVSLAASLLQGGKIIALKGVGGYNLICSPFDPYSVKDLRELKRREEKPFAVMFSDLTQVRRYCEVSEEEAALLESGARPIVLLERKGENRAICEETYKTSRFIGAFLPSTGIQCMLLSVCGPLIVTSANGSDQPIIKDDQEMFGFMESQGREYLAGVFYNEREIRVRVDDSVARIIDGQPQLIRRSKGYAPVPLYVRNSGIGRNACILGYGGQLKASFCLSKGPFAYVSQYFGDLDGAETAEVFRENISRMEALFRIEPKLLVCDLHPLYHTTKLAEEAAHEAKKKGADHGSLLVKVQHHHAHVASVMAEHGLKGPVIGVSFDGTGFGSDGAIWGGEFLICEGSGFKRAAHLEYIRMLGGDGSMKEGWKSAMSYLCRYRERTDDFEGHPLLKDGRYPLVEAGIRGEINTIASSSMGRLFDAVASFLGIHHVNRYEGECAILLENFAAEALERGIFPMKMSFDIVGTQISALPIFHRMETGLENGIDKRGIALGFHYAVAEMILKICKAINERKGIRQVALTGGVFQNKILMERTLSLLRENQFDVYYNISTSPGDGGICLGQVYVAMQYLSEMKWE